jgi:hypothetical protein
VLGFSGLLCADAEPGPLLLLTVGDVAGAVKLRVALGPVGALKAAGPRGGDRGFGERGSSFLIARTGDRSRDDLEDSLKGRGDRSRVIGELTLVRSSRGGCCTASLLG